MDEFELFGVTLFSKKIMIHKSPGQSFYYANEGYQKRFMQKTIFCKIFKIQCIVFLHIVDYLTSGDPGIEKGKWK